MKKSGKRKNGRSGRRKRRSLRRNSRSSRNGRKRRSGRRRKRSGERAAGVMRTGVQPRRVKIPTAAEAPGSREEPDEGGRPLAYLSRLSAA